jgi:dTMP kinase
MAPFIAFEGIDGCGKGTQAKLLCDRLKDAGREPLLTVEPTRGPIGKLIREHMASPFLEDKSLALMFASDRIEHLDKEIRPAMESEKIVVSDRYVYSSIAYQGQTIDIDWVGEINSYADRPDLVILIDVSPRTARKRMEDREDDFEYFEEDPDFQEGCRRTFHGFVKGKHLPEELRTEFLVVDGEKGISEIGDIIWDHVMEMLKK